MTARQQAFLIKLIELYRAEREPVHYTDVAKRLGVNRFSAYDMLRVLERKGFARSSYALAEGHSGPGRSTVVFAPTAQARALAAHSAEDDRLGDDWRRLRERILARLRGARDASPREALTELLSWLPDAKAPLAYCAEMVGVLLLNMRRVKSRAGGLNPFHALAALRANGGSELEALAGLSVGATLAADDDAASSLTHRLLEHARRYQTSLTRLSAEARSALARFLEEALEALD